MGSRFLKLSRISTCRSIFINFDLVESFEFEAGLESCTNLYFVNGDDRVSVKETPEEIMEMLEEGLVPQGSSESKPIGKIASLESMEDFYSSVKAGLLIQRRTVDSKEEWRDYDGQSYQPGWYDYRALTRLENEEDRGLKCTSGTEIKCECGRSYDIKERQS